MQDDGQAPPDELLGLGRGAHHCSGRLAVGRLVELHGDPELEVERLLPRFEELLAHQVGHGEGVCPLWIGAWPSEKARWSGSPQGTERATETTVGVGVLVGSALASSVPAASQPIDHPTRPSTTSVVTNAAVAAGLNPRFTTDLAVARSYPMECVIFAWKRRPSTRADLALTRGAG